jgi:hypothetical protein
MSGKVAAGCGGRALRSATSPLLMMSWQSLRRSGTCMEAHRARLFILRAFACSET